MQRDSTSSGGRGHSAAQVAQRWITLPGAVFSRAPCPAYVGSEYDVVAAVLGVSGIQSGSLGTAAHWICYVFVLEVLLQAGMDVLGSPSHQNWCLLNKSDFDHRVSIKYDFDNKKSSKSA